MSNAKKFSELVNRYKSGKATQQERDALEAFIEQSGKEDLFAQLPQEDQELLHDDMLAHLSRRIREPKKKQVFLRTTWFKAAAAIIVLAVASFVMWQWQSVETISIATLSQTQKVILPDGSIIWLKENSSLSYPDRFTGNERNVSFTGEALFEVAKDANHPFVISGTNSSAKVLGTSFNLRMDSLVTDLTVLTGKVALNPIGKASILVNAHERATYRKNDSELAIKEVKPDEANTIVKGTEYDMQFDAAPLSEVAEKIQKKFEVTISLTDKRMGNCRVTADFTDQSLELTLTKISEILGYEYEADGRTITIRGEGCN